MEGRTFGSCRLPMNILPAIPKMAGVGLAEFCRHIELIDIGKLMAPVAGLEENAENLRLEAERKTKAYRRALDEQYDHIFRSV